MPWSSIFYLEKHVLKSLFSWNENWKKCTSFEEQKCSRYIQVSLSSAVFHQQILICFAQEVKSFHQTSLGNEFDSTDMFPEISWLKIKISKNWDKVL